MLGVMESISSVLTTIPVWLLWPIVAGIALYWYMTRHYDYWKKLDIPHVVPVPFIGSMGRLFLNTMHDVELDRYMKNGRIYGTYEGRRPALTVADPDLLRDILVKDFQHFTGRRNIATGNSIADKMVQNLNGEDWKRIRTIITPAFTTGKIKKMTSIFEDSSKTLAANFKTAVELGKPVECKRYFGAFTMDVIASSAFGTKIDSHNDPTNAFVTTARTVFSRNVPWRFILLFLFPAIMKLFRIAVFAPGAMAFFKKVTLQIIKERKEKNQTRNDFLQLMIDSVKEQNKDLKSSEKLKKEEMEEDDKIKQVGHEEGNDEIFKPSYISTKSLSEDELVAQCVIFFLAGYDTTASTLSFSAYELALNPEVQEKLISEIDETLRQKGELSHETICGMKYLDGVVSETLRKYPPAIRTERLADRDYQLKGTDITVPKGMVVGIPIYAIHHDPENFPNPEQYEPERFTSEQKASRHAYTYMPFGAGPRNCVAMRFALMEVKVCLANVLKQFRFKTCPETKIPLEYYAGQGLMQPKEVMLKVEIRTDAVKM